MSKEQLLGRVLCKGSGLKVFAEIKLNRKIGQEVETKTFRYNIGSLQKIISETNRATQLSYVAGRSTAAGVSKGIRSTFGEITFESMDAGMLSAMLDDVKKFNRETSKLEAASLDGFSFEDYTIADEGAALLSSAKTISEINVYEKEAICLDDLPPIDIIVLGYADQIEGVVGEKYERGNTYQFRLNAVTFLSETFGISAGAPLHNVATKVHILGGIIPWKKVKVGV